MWWSDLRAIALVLVVPLLTACGFTPVLGDRGVEARAQERLAQIEIAPLGGLVGAYLRNDLLDRLQAEDRPSNPSHRLEVGLSPHLFGSLVEPDASVTRYNYTLRARYRLVDLSNNAVVLEGDTEAMSAYNVVESEYATVVARRAAEERAARVLSDDLSLRLALFFSE
jgi:LPS-assembly lipoprotein